MLLNLDKKVINKVTNVDEIIVPRDKIDPFHRWKVNIVPCGIIDLKENIIPTKSVVINEHNLPDLIYRRLTINDYHDPTGAFLTGSGLAINPKQFYFKRLYKNAQISDANDMVASMLGTALHNHMEAIELPGDVVEKRFTVTINNQLLSAQLDHYGNFILSDYKLTRAWKKAKRIEMYEKGLEKQDGYVLQMNLNAYLLRQRGYKVDKARLVFIYKDYNKYTYKANYPYAQAEEEWVPLWSDEEVERILKAKVDQLVSVKRETVQMHICTDKEMWRDDTVYSIAKVGSGRSLPNTGCNTIDEVEKKLRERLSKKGREMVVPDEWYDLSDKSKIDNASKYDGMLYIKVSSDEPKFCLDYCPGRLYCRQHQEWYLGNKRYDIKVIQGDKQKTIQMYGENVKDAMNKAKLIHDDDCKIENPNGGKAGISKLLKDI